MYVCMCGMCVACVLVGDFFFFIPAQVAGRALGTVPTSETRDALLSPSNQKGGGENAEKVVALALCWLVWLGVMLRFFKIGGTQEGFQVAPL